MAMTLTIALGRTPQVVVGRPTCFILAVTNDGASALTLNSLTVSEQTKSGAIIAQPTFATPNVAPGTGNPSIGAATTVYYPFNVTFTSPMVGPSPQQPGGPAPSNRAEEANSNFILQAVGQTSDGSVFSNSLMVPALSSIAPFPLAQGGAFQFAAGANLVNLLTTGA